MFTVSALALSVTLPHAATDQDRPVLSGVLLRQDGAIVATDGKTLALYRNGHTVPTEIILPATKELRALVKVALKGVGLEHGTIEVVPGDGSWTLKYAGQSLEIVPIEDSFPLVDKVFPKVAGTVGHIGFDLNLLSRFTEGWPIEKYKGTRRNAFRFDFGQDNTFAVTLTRDGHPNFIGLAMPYTVADMSVPDTLTPALKETAA